MKKIFIILLVHLMVLTGLTRAQSSFAEHDYDSYAAEQGTGQTNHSRFFKHHALFFFFASSCPLCQEFAPLLKSWAQAKHMQIVAFSLDDQPLTSFAQFYIPPTQLINTAFRDQPIATPALFIVNNKTNVLYPVAFGALARAELDERLQALIASIKSYEGYNE